MNDIHVASLPEVIITFNFAELHDPNFISGLFINSLMLQASMIMSKIREDNYKLNYRFIDVDANCHGNAADDQEHRQCGVELVDKIVEIIKHTFKPELYSCNVTRRCKYESGHLLSQGVLVDITYTPERQSPGTIIKESRDYAEKPTYDGSTEEELVGLTYTIKL